MTTTTLTGDCREVLATLPADSFDACVTDPPYEIAFMGRAWDQKGVAFDPETWAAVLRVLKPGAHMLCFGGTRTSHRMVCAIEDAGFEIRDTLMWLYGSGLTKSRNHLKPAYEPIILCRKPLDGTVAANILRHGTGAINVAATRIPTGDDLNGGAYSGDLRRRAEYVSTDTADGAVLASRFSFKRGIGQYQQPTGRWPANVLHDGSDEVMDAFAAFGNAPGQQRYVGPEHGAKSSVNCFGDFGVRGASQPRGDTGTAARFFYCAKAGKADRAGSKHPTIKPIALIRYLCRLITPLGGMILDPFAGSGTTGEAAMVEGFNATLIEQDPASVADIQRRIDRWSGADMALLAEAAD